MPRKRDTDSPLIKELISGFFNPVIELCIGTMIGALIIVGESLASSTGAPNLLSNIPLILTLTSIVDYVKDIYRAFKHTELAVGNVIGNVLGLFIFYGAINAASPESAIASLIWIIVMIISLFVRCIIAVWQKGHNGY